MNHLVSRISTGPKAMKVGNSNREERVHGLAANPGLKHGALYVDSHAARSQEHAAQEAIH